MKQLQHFYFLHICSNIYCKNQKICNLAYSVVGTDDNDSRYLEMIIGEKSGEEVRRAFKISSKIHVINVLKI